MTITIEVARDLLLRAVATQGRDFIYKPVGAIGHCFYTPTGAFGLDDPRAKTGCLIGVAMGLAGYTDLPEGVRIGQIAVVNPSWLDEASGEYFGVAQKVQDFGMPWGAAFDNAEQAYWSHLRLLGRM